MISTPLSRRSALGLIGSAGVSLALPSCVRSDVGIGAPPAPRDANALLDEVAWKLLELAPENATALGLDTGAHSGLRHRLSDKSPRGIARLAETLRRDLAKVRAINGEALDPAVQTSLAVVESAFATAIEGLALPYGEVAVGGWRNTPYVVIQNVGAYLDLPRFMDSSHPVRNSYDAEAYCDRLDQMSAQLDEETQRVAAAEALGLIPPDFLLTRTIDQMERSLADMHSSDGGILATSLAKRTATIPGDWEMRSKAIVTDSISSALERQLALMKRHLSQARSNPGIGSRPFGEEWYAWALHAATTTRLTPTEIHQRGKEELAATQARMEPILRSLGYSWGSIGERMTALAKDTRYRYPDNDAGRGEIITFISQRIDWIKKQMPRAFLRLAPGNVEVRRLPLAEEPGAPSAYGGAGSIDGSIPGRIWINLHTTDLHRKYDLPTLVHHEAVPGHVWQGEYTHSTPLIRSILAFNSYSEGWALYAEQMGDELGAYDEFPAGRLGYLQNQGWRAARLVLDTGLHAMGWSRKQANLWFQREVGLSPAETVNEIDRYCSWPGQACGYKVGHSEIVRLRESARKTLGDSFDLRGFNQAVVDGGNVPLDVLSGIVERYIAAVRRV